MYPKYFGLKEPSFSIAPDPHYLFLSEQHREALAHLLYGAGDVGGFVLLTGEVGTGKTTVCRAFLEQLPAGVEVALILNPMQSASELLVNICEEFRIQVPPGRRSVKLLVDRLNRYLLDSHANGRRPVLIIDEAQNLQPHVLEQIRLLTNLETTKQKLLQIFLIGQPELRRLLESEQLRQLDQRITARFHLTAFDLRDTGDYIRHRVAVAGVDRPLFTAGAIRLIHRYSGGIPRLINLLCDRALLGTCVTRGSQVTPTIVAKAAAEVLGQPTASASRIPVSRAVGFALIAFLLSLAGGWSGYVWLQEQAPASIAGAVWRVLGLPRPQLPPDAAPTATSPDAPPAAARAPTTPDAPAPAMAAAVQPAATPPVVPPLLDLASLDAGALDAALAGLALPESAAMQLLLRRWGVTVEDLGGGDPCAALPKFGLRCEHESGKFSHLRFFDLPVLLRVSSPSGGGRFVVLTALTDSEATLDLTDGRQRVPLAGLERVWTGDYTLVWQPPPGGVTRIAAGSGGEDVRWLRVLLSKVPGSGVAASDSPHFDPALAAAVRAFQSSRGLQPDGIAGPRTLIQLYNLLAMPGIPHLGAAPSLPTAVVPP